jgi:hypothetical protein
VIDRSVARLTTRPKDWSDTPDTDAIATIWRHGSHSKARPPCFIGALQAGTKRKQRATTRCERSCSDRELDPETLMLQCCSVVIACDSSR